MEQLLVIANGRVGGSRRWKAAEVRLREIFGNRLEIRFTRSQGDATQIARQALLSGTGWLAAAGGDGTINEVVNGFFEQGCNISPEAALSLLPCGSGNDYARMFGVAANPCLAAETLERSRTRKLDVGLARFPDVNGKDKERIFVNIAEAGAGGTLVARQDGWLCRSRVGYRITSLTTALSFRPYPLQLMIDGVRASIPTPVLNLIVAGGRYFGNGMHCAPMARPDDGLLEVITIGDFGFLEILAKIGTFFSGSYLGNAKVAHSSAHTVEAVGPEAVCLELDGEMVGTLPAAFTVLPGALLLRY